MDTASKRDVNEVLDSEWVRAALAAGKAYGVPLFNTALVHEVMTALMAQGHQDLDHSGIARFVEELSGLEG